MKLNVRFGGFLGVLRNKCYSIFWEGGFNWKISIWYIVVLIVIDFILLRWEVYTYGLELYLGILINMELNVDICSDIFEVFFEIEYYNFLFDNWYE